MGELGVWAWKQIGFSLMMFGIVIGVSWLPIHWLAKIGIYAVIMGLLLAWFGSLTVKSFLKGLGTILAFNLFFVVLGKFGIIGLLLASIALFAWFPLFHWKKYLALKYQVETMIYGMPIHKFKEQGLKLPKLKIKF